MLQQVVKNQTARADESHSENERLRALLREARDVVYGCLGEDAEGPHPIVDRIDEALK